jgi:EAL domain-containing protein (putative c-di-GMP-specific phosphodiesterase class I)
MVPVYGSPPSRITFHSLVPGFSSAHHREDESVCSEIRALGVRVSLDEFGSCSSSLNYVKDLPVDSLKIDKSFINGLGEDPVNDAIVRLIVDFAHTLGLKVTAEGVENPRQVASLTAMRCDQAQGFYFSKPLPSEAVRALVATNPLWQVPKRKYYRSRRH